MSSEALLENFFLSHSSDSYVVEFSPNALEMVFDEGEVVSTFCATIMDAHGVEVVGNVTKVLICLFNLCRNRFDLLLKTLDLLSCLFNIAL
jgi:hypothetical protein